MVRMMEPHTGVTFYVSDANAARRVKMGFVPLDAVPAAAGEAPRETDETDAEDSGDKPDMTSTVAEIRAYAKEHGIKLPAGGTKPKLLSLL